MDSGSHTVRAHAGHTLVEVLVVLAIMGVCAVVGARSIAYPLGVTESRASAQAWQAAAAAAQNRAIWSGERARVAADGEGLSVFGGDPADSVTTCLGPIPVIPSANVGAWSVPTGPVVTFAAATAAPDSGGTLTFGSAAYRHRVVVRVETGLTRRSTR